MADGTLLGTLGGILGRAGATFGSPGMENFAGILDPGAFQQNLSMQAIHGLMQDPNFQGPGGMAKAMIAIRDPATFAKIVGGDVSTDAAGNVTRIPLGGSPQTIGQVTPKPEMVEPGSTPYYPGYGYGIPGQSSGATGGIQGQPSQQPQPMQPGNAQTGPQSNAAPSSNGMNTNGMLSQDSLKDMALRVLKTGDKSVFQRTGYGNIGQINNANLQNAIDQTARELGMQPQDISNKIAGWDAYEKGIDRLSTVQTNMGTAQIEARQILPLFQKAVKDYYGQTGQFPAINAIQQAVSTHTGDPRVIQIGNYLNALRNTYARGISTRPQGPTDSDKHNFDDTMNKFWAPDQIDAAAAAINKELDVAYSSIPKMRNQLGVQFGFGNPADPGTLAQAKQALARGAPRDKIKQRLEENGFTDEGL